MFIYFKNKSYCLKSVFFLAVINLIAVNPASAFNVTFTDTGFEDSGDGTFTGWLTTGDATIQSTFQGISPTNGAYQALITNGCPTTAESLCNSSTTGDGRNDDIPRSIGTFNYSGNDQVNASFGEAKGDTTNREAFKLQEFFGLDDNGLSVAREGGINSGVRTPKEGSGIKQNIQITITQADVDNGLNAFNLSFNYAFLSNDGTNSLLGNQDFAFLSLYDTASSPDDIIVLADSDDTLTSVSSDNFVNQDTTFHTTSNQFSYSVSGLAAGTYNYSLGFGVVDVDNVDRTSALLLDNLQITQDVPFKFSPGLGLSLAFCLIICDRIARNFKNNHQ